VQTAPYLTDPQFHRVNVIQYLVAKQQHHQVQHARQLTMPITQTVVLSKTVFSNGTQNHKLTLQDVQILKDVDAKLQHLLRSTPLRFGQEHAVITEEARYHQQSVQLKLLRVVVILLCSIWLMFFQPGVLPLVPPSGQTAIISIMFHPSVHAVILIDACVKLQHHPKTLW
jgi:hypothetical protein